MILITMQKSLQGIMISMPTYQACNFHKITELLWQLYVLNEVGAQSGRCSIDECDDPIIYTVIDVMIIAVIDMMT